MLPAYSHQRLKRSSWMFLGAEGHMMVGWGSGGQSSTSTGWNGKGEPPEKREIGVEPLLPGDAGVVNDQSGGRQTPVDPYDNEGTTAITGG